MSGLRISTPCSLAPMSIHKLQTFSIRGVNFGDKTKFFACYLETLQPTNKPKKTRIHSKLLNVHSYHQSVYLPKSHIISEMSRKKEKIRSVIIT